MVKNNQFGQKPSNKLENGQKWFTKKKKKKKKHDPKPLTPAM